MLLEAKCRTLFHRSASYSRFTIYTRLTDFRSLLQKQRSRIFGLPVLEGRVACNDLRQGLILFVSLVHVGCIHLGIVGGKELPL